jgi:hypothetical protein
MQAGVDQAGVNQANANASRQAAIGSIIGGVSNMASSVVQSGAFGGFTPQVSGVNPVQSEGYTPVSDPAGNFLDNKTEPIVIG